MTTAPAPGASPADRDVTGQQAVHHVRVSGSDEVFDVPVGQRIHAAARRAGIWFPFECGWGSCGSCKATVVEGRTELLFPGAPAVEPRDERRRRVVLCQSTPCGDLVIRPRWVDHQPPPERPLRDYLGRLVDVEPLGPAIARFRFELTDNDGSPLVADYRPGQFAILETEPGLRRCLSLAAPQRAPGLWGSGFAESHASASAMARIQVSGFLPAYLLISSPTSESSDASSAGPPLES